MNKIKIAALLTLLLAFVVAVVAFAGGFAIVSYDDTSLKGYDPGDSVTTPQYIVNGDFTEWENGRPVGWNVPEPTLSPNWEVHLAQMDYAAPGGEEGGINNAVGYFFRAGSAGSQFAGLSQQVAPDLTTGNYWVQVHVTAWEYNVKSPYNSVAWYGFGSSSDPASVTEWRELFPDTYVCANGDGVCNHLGRKETVSIEAGSYLHLWMGMKFPDHQSWTTFGIDDVSITDLSDGINVEVDDFVDEGDVHWDPEALR